MPVENNLAALGFCRSRLAKFADLETHKWKRKRVPFMSLDLQNFASRDLQKTLACLNVFNCHTRVIKRLFYFPRDINNYYLSVLGHFSVLRHKIQKYFFDEIVTYFQLSK